ncbi:TetR/AcrR family transcriptional regulator [Microbacterium sp. NPDC058062]|uniref:TetR/AcrR family transcriptional regulator n=1 Tax=Microbacterium sp. NPDC058062 TaxID=3346320 RepID=UPI0036DCA238
MARTKRGLATRAAFRDAARTVFARDGYLNARLVDIAEEAERSPGLLYQHYDGKAELLADLADNFSEELREAVKQAGRTGPRAPVDLRPQIQAFWLTYRRRMGEVVGITQAAAVDPEFRQRWKELQRESTDMVARGIRHAQEEGFCPTVDPILAASALTLMVENFCAFWQHQGGFDDVQMTDDQAVDTLYELWRHAIYWKPAPTGDATADSLIPAAASLSTDSDSMPA